jgi:uncharacterized protein (DUF362 family)
VSFTRYRESVTEALDAIGAADLLPDNRLIILKPNLTNASRPPVTTPVAIVEAVYAYCRQRCRADIAIGEGCGEGRTADTFRANGYESLARREGIELIDFNHGETVQLSNPDAHALKTFHLPAVVQDAFVVSIPVLKDHCFTTTTIAMKNMFGIAPGSQYGGSWNKSKLHHPSSHLSVVDVCSYKKPDLCIVDAVVALEGMHLAGTPRRLDTVLASFDPVAIDAVGSEMLGHDPESIEYLRLADGVLGEVHADGVAATSRST